MKEMDNLYPPIIDGYCSRTGDAFMKVVDSLVCVCHPCTLIVTGICRPVDGVKPHIFMSFANCAIYSLDKIMLERENEQSCRLDHTEMSIIISGIAFGMQHLHFLNIVHRFLKPASVFLDEHLWPRIGEYELGLLIESHVIQGSGVCADAYQAPEMYSECVNYTEKIDVFSYGMILFELIFQKSGLSGSAVDIEDKCKNGMRESLDPENGDAAFGVNQVVIDLIDRCWSVNAAVRPSFREVIEILASVEFKIFSDVDEHDLNHFIGQIHGEGV